MHLQPKINSVTTIGNIGPHKMTHKTRRNQIIAHDNAESFDMKVSSSITPHKPHQKIPQQKQLAKNIHWRDNNETLKPVSRTSCTTEIVRTKIL